MSPNDPKRTWAGRANRPANPIPPTAKPCCNRGVVSVVLSLGKAMRRRDFIKVVAGSAATWPLAAHAQQAAMPMIGFLRTGSLIEVPYFVNAFHRGLEEADYVEGQNV